MHTMQNGLTDAQATMLTKLVKNLVKTSQTALDVLDHGYAHFDSLHGTINSVQLLYHLAGVQLCLEELHANGQLDFKRLKTITDNMRKASGKEEPDLG